MDLTGLLLILVKTLPTSIKLIHPISLIEKLGALHLPFPLTVLAPLFCSIFVVNFQQVPSNLILPIIQLQDAVA